MITNALRDRVYQINKDNGWHEEKRTFGELIALVHSEVSEALEDYRNGKAVNKAWYEYKNEDGSIDKVSGFIRNGVLGKPCGIPSELADVVIRILDICGMFGWNIELSHQRKVPFRKQKFAAHLASIHKSLSDCYYDDKDTHTDPVIDYLDVAIQEIQYICNQHNIDLAAIIEEKLAYNATRGHKHGGKVI